MPSLLNTNLYLSSNVRLFSVKTPGGLLEQFVALPVTGIKFISENLPRLLDFGHFHREICGLSLHSVSRMQRTKVSFVLKPCLKDYFFA